MTGLAYGSYHKLPENEPVREGYDFKGWSYSADATTPEFYLTGDRRIDDFVSSSHWFTQLDKPYIPLLYWNM